MKLSRGQNSLALETLAAMITHSQIVVVQPAKPVSRLPAGFDEVDIALSSTGLPVRGSASAAAL